MLIITIIIGIIILSIIILAHESGHFFAAKMSGVKVEEFGFGFPPRLCKLFKKGETLYSLNWIPFGGFNKILGEEAGSKDPRAFCNKSVWRRIFIASAGIIANLFLAWCLFTIWFLIVPRVNLPDYVAIVEVNANSAAEKAGLKANDLILEINNVKLHNVQELTQFTKTHLGQEADFLIRSQGKDATKKIKLDQNSDAPLGVGLAETGGVKPDIKWYQAPIYAFGEMYAVVSLTIVYLFKGIVSLFGGPKVPFEISGPVGAVAFISQTVSVGWLFLIRLAAVISLGLAIFNILPIPAVDGGRLAFLWPEAVLGKKIIHPDHENTIHAVGFIILIILSLVIVYFDISRLF